MGETFTFRDLAPGDAGWIAMRHGELYWRDEGYDIAFEGMVLGLLSSWIADHGPDERAWVALDGDGRRVGCLFSYRPAPRTARLRMFMVEPELRGSGLAQRMLDQAVAHARATNALVMMVWTHASHARAVGLYRRNGFDMVEESPVAPFGQPTMEQHYMRQL